MAASERNSLRGVKGQTQKTIDARKLAILKRAGRDPVELDTRPAHVIMNDNFPFERWEKERNVINRAGYRTWEDLLKARHDAKKHERS